jgi:hypothetical protein
MDLNATAKLLLDEAARRSWVMTHRPYGPEEDRDAEPGSIRLEIPVPGRDTHRVHVLQRGNTVEIAYHDGLPPGPAEAQFIFAPGEEEGAIGEAFDFVDEILDGRVLAVREPLAWWARLMVRSDSALRFRRD